MKQSFMGTPEGHPTKQSFAGTPESYPTKQSFAGTPVTTPHKRTVKTPVGNVRQAFFAGT